MAVQAYVLTRVAVGSVEKVSQEISKIPGVKSVHKVTGRYDLIILVEAEDISSLGRFIISKIHSVEGVERTETAIIV